jgi:hypothetical protein
VRTSSRGRLRLLLLLLLVLLLPGKLRGARL